MSDTKDLKLSTLPITTPTAPIVLNIPLKPKIDIPAPSNAPRQVDFDILPASEEATIPLILPPEIPQHKQDGGDVVVVEITLDTNGNVGKVSGLLTGEKCCKTFTRTKYETIEQSTGKTLRFCSDVHYRSYFQLLKLFETEQTISTPPKKSTLLSIEDVSNE